MLKLTLQVLSILTFPEGLERASFDFGGARFTHAGRKEGRSKRRDHRGFRHVSNTAFAC